MKKLITNLQNKEMDRKQFLQFVGGAALIISGVVGLTKSFRSLHTGKGYGGSAYGRTPKDV